MDTLLLEYYKNELKHLRDMAGEFAKAYPKIAKRLGLDGVEAADEIPDPYVERLLEGFAFMAARVHLKIDAEFPRFTNHLFEMIYPHYLTPKPSMAIVRFQPDLNEGSLVSGFTVPRDTSLRSAFGGSETACEYRTAHDVTLWPLQLVEAAYMAHLNDLPPMFLPGGGQARAGIRLRLKCSGGFTMDQLDLNSLTIFFQGSGGLPVQIYERFFAQGLAVAVVPVQRPASWVEINSESPVQQVGFDGNQALIPCDNRSFSGYRLLQEYFGFPERFLFARLEGLRAGFKRCTADQLDIIVLLARSEPFLEKVVDVSTFELFATPAVNLFEKRADRIHLSNTRTQNHVVPDRSRPMDFEVYQVTEVTGYGSAGTDEQVFLPFYAANDITSADGRNPAYYAVQRDPRLRSEKQRRHGTRSSYLGSEVFISLVDAANAPYKSELKQLSVKTLCTNRDLALHMPLGQGKTDFTLEIGAPVESTRCISGPTRPMPSFIHGETAWRLISHLSLNYLSLADSDGGKGATALRELLDLYVDTGDAAQRKQVEGVKSVHSRAVDRPIVVDGHAGVGRGLEVTVTFDEMAFEGSGIFILGSVLEHFFSRYAGINSFTETVIKTLNRGEVMRWPIRNGRRHLI